MMSIDNKLSNEEKKILEMIVWSDKLPSHCNTANWIYAENERTEASQETIYRNNITQSGKWMIFSTPEEIDYDWIKIRNAIENGILGSAAKVSTYLSQSFQSDQKYLICVYTYDFTDYEDVMRVRNELRILGFTQNLGYKTDADTLAGKYRATGYRKVCLYRS